MKPDKPNTWSSPATAELRSSNYKPYKLTQSPKVTRLNYTGKYSDENFPPRQSSNINQIRPDRGSYSREFYPTKTVVSPLQERKRSYVIANEAIDYKTLFEREKRDRQVM